MNFSFELSTKNFINVSKIAGKDEFHFVIANQNIYCHKFLAAFISNYVSQILQSDPTTNSFHIKISKHIFTNEEQKLQCEQKMIMLLQKLVNGEALSIYQKDIESTNQQLMNSINLYEQPKFMSNEFISLLILTELLDNEELRQQLYSFLFLSNKLKPVDERQQVKKEEIENKIKKILQIECLHNLLKKLQNDKKYEYGEDVISHAKKFINEDYDCFINEISAHFFEIETSIITNLSSFILRDVLSSPNLKIESEDSLLQILLRRYKKVRNDLNEELLIEFVQFEFLSEKVVSEFLNEIELNDINNELWHSIKKRLILPVKNKTKNKRTIKTSASSFEYKEILYDDQHKFEGIFNYLTNISKGNILTNNTIEVKHARLCCGDIKTLFDYNNQKCWTHILGKPSWIQFNFKDRAIQINSYMIKSRHGNGGSSYLKSWHVEISDDGIKWTQIDKQTNVSELNGKNYSQVFNISMTKPFKFIKITEDESWNDSCDFRRRRLMFIVHKPFCC